MRTFRSTYSRTYIHIKYTDLLLTSTQTDLITNRHTDPQGEENQENDYENCCNTQQSTLRYKKFKRQNVSFPLYGKASSIIVASKSFAEAIPSPRPPSLCSGQLLCITRTFEVSDSSILSNDATHESNLDFPCFSGLCDC